MDPFHSKNLKENIDPDQMNQQKERNLKKRQSAISTRSFVSAMT